MGSMIQNEISSIKEASIKAAQESEWSKNKEIEKNGLQSMFWRYYI